MDNEMDMTDPKFNMIWMDLEMTGLDPETNSIIEIATLVTNGNLDILAEGPNLVIHQPDRLLNAMDDWNKKQHQKSGLLDNVKASEITLKGAEKATLDFIKMYCLPKTAPLCGNAVHHDRRFIVKYMSELNEYIHYRHIDVTTLKLLVQRWYLKDDSLPKKKETHRALDDIRESIEELKYYRKNYLK